MSNDGLRRLPPPLEKKYSREWCLKNWGIWCKYRGCNGGGTSSMATYPTIGLYTQEANKNLPLPMKYRVNLVYNDSVWTMWETLIQMAEAARAQQVKESLEGKICT